MQTTSVIPYLFLFTALPSSAFDLKQAWQAAQAHSADYAAAQYARDAEIEQQYQARSALLPQIGLTGQYQKQPASLSTNTNSYGWALQVDQVLYDPVRQLRYKQGKLAAHSADMKLKQIQNELLLSTAQAYFDVLLNKDKLASIRDEKNAHKQQLVQAKAVFDRGAATVVDIYEAKAGFDAALAKEIVTKTDLILAENRLTDLTGLDASKVRPIKMLQQSFASDIRQERNWQALAEQYNPEWIRQNLELENAKAASKAAKSGRLPKLNFNAGYQSRHNTQDYYGRETHYRSKGGSFGIQLNIPLYTGGQTSSQIREAVAREMQNKEQMVAIDRKIRLSVKQAYQNVRSNYYRFMAQRRLLDSEKSKLAATILGKKVGVRSNLEEVRARQAYSEAEQQLAEAQYTYILSYVQLLQRAGILDNEIQMKRVNDALFW